MNIDLAKHFNLNSMSEEDRARFVEAVLNLAFARVAVVVGDQLSEDEASEFDKLGDDNPEAVMDWLDAHVPSFAETFDGILADVARDLDGKIQALAEYSANTYKD